MKKLLITILLLITTNAYAETWQESFEGATSKNQCERLFDKMKSNTCTFAGIYRGGQDQRQVNHCHSQAKSLKEDCIERIAEEEAEKKEKENEIAHDKWLYNITSSQQPNVVVGCIKTSGSNDVNFTSNIELNIWNRGACRFNGYTHTCSIHDTNFSGYVGERKWELSRITGDLRLTGKDVHGNYQSANYSCQKASAIQKKF